MDSARGQAERYAKALPVDHGWPPFLLVTDVGYCIDVYADFSGTGKAYTQFPDAARFRIMLDDLRDEAVRARLAAIWTDPHSLDASKEAARVTREIADKLAELSKRLEARENNPTRVADFLMRCLFTMFAEDVGLIPHDSFKTLLKKMQARPENLRPALADLWAKMDKGGFVGALGEAGETVRRFNGYLFKDQTVIELKEDEIGLLLASAEKKWDKVEPAIFGTLLERALGAKERAKLGAHYTPRAYVERLVMPTVMEPLRADWDGVRGAAGQLIDEGKAEEARKVVETFHGKLAQTKVLDPACGTGNFLYVAMARMKELEGEVIALLTELGDDQYVAELSGHTITPENFLGIEVNPRAAAIAQLVLWIGYLQWHFRVNGADKMPNEPILRDVRTIENRDALIEWDDKVLERGPDGRPLTRWDGETTKLHPVTGKKVPDENARVEVWRYVKPRAAKWPKANFIVGNPPFHGARTMRQSTEPGYMEAVRSAYSMLPDNIDFVMYWWDRAAALTARGTCTQFGFITTKSITQSFSRTVIERHLAPKNGVAIVFAIPNHPWIDSGDGAAVRVAFTVASHVPRGKPRPWGGLFVESFSTPLDEGEYELSFDLYNGPIDGRLTLVGASTDVRSLKANAGLSSVGYQLTGKGFELSKDELRKLPSEQHDGVVFRLIGARDVVQHRRERHVIEVSELAENELKSSLPAIYQHLLSHVKPERDANARASVRNFWWVYGEARSTFRPARRGLRRIIVTPITAKHRLFELIPSDWKPDSTCVMIALEDGLTFGVLSSRFHVVWAAHFGGRLGKGDDLRYLKAECFDRFPFPADVPEALADRIRAEAEALDALRKRVLAEHEDLTLTGLYNVLEALRAGRALTDKERDIHDRGLVTLIRQHHDAIDVLVAEAYGWRAEHDAGTLTDAVILERLVALNKQRAAEEAKGIVRWLRPEYQAPGAERVAVNADLDLGDTPKVAPTATILPWPKSLPEQVSAVAAVLAGASGPMSPRDVAASFKGKRASTVEPVLGALAAIGRARKLKNGRYAA